MHNRPAAKTELATALAKFGTSTGQHVGENAAFAVGALLELRGWLGRLEGGGRSARAWRESIDCRGSDRSHFSSRVVVHPHGHPNRRYRYSRLLDLPIPDDGSDREFLLAIFEVRVRESASLVDGGRGRIDLGRGRKSRVRSLGVAM